MAITFDPAKRAWTMENRGPSFEDAPIVFGGPRYDPVDLRRDYGETRVVTAGFLAGRIVSLAGHRAARTSTYSR